MDITKLWPPPGAYLSIVIVSPEIISQNIFILYYAYYQTMVPQVFFYRDYNSTKL